MKDEVELRRSTPGLTPRWGGAKGGDIPAAPGIVRDYNNMARRKFEQGVERNRRAGRRVCRAYALGKLRVCAVPALVAAIKDRHRAVPRYSSEALGRLGDPAAFRALKTAHRGPAPCVRRAAVLCLATMAGPAAAPALRAILSGGVKGGRREATLVLSKIGRDDSETWWGNDALGG